MNVKHKLKVEEYILQNKGDRIIPSVMARALRISVGNVCYWLQKIQGILHIGRNYLIRAKCKVFTIVRTIRDVFRHKLYKLYISKRISKDTYLKEINIFVM